MVVVQEIPLICPDGLSFLTAKNTKPLKAKHIQHLFTDPSVVTKFLLATLEGQQALKTDSIVCVGNDDDAWQQTSKNLFKKYNITGMDENGWLICEPKPENEVWAAQFEFAGPLGAIERFQIIGLWGDKVSDGTYRQCGYAGDYILKSKTDPKDVWIVAKKVFENTYTLV